MRCIVVGAGPAGLTLGIGLARRGHGVTIVERDPGPEAGGRWPRRGVMQFHHPHGVRPQVQEVLAAEAPIAYELALRAGAEPVVMTLPDGTERAAGLRIRRATLERAMRAAALTTPGLVMRQGNAEEVLAGAGRAAGIRVDGAVVAADLVVDATGRSGRLSQAWRAPAEIGGDTGIAYVCREYRLLSGAEPGPLTSPLAYAQDGHGYQVLVFPHEHGIFSVVLVRPADDRRLRGLRHAAAFEAACRAVPGAAQWTDPARSRPVTPVLVGGRLYNHYRSQQGPAGGLALPGLFFAGDAVATTTPVFGRGIATSLLQVRELLRLLEEHGRDLGSAGQAFDAWCEAAMRPWVEDHVYMDGDLRRRWAGGEVDLSHRLPSDLVVAAVPSDPRIAAGIAPYLTMTGMPSSLDPVEPLAREVYRSGWRPTLPAYPTREDLAEIVAAHDPGVRRAA